MTTYTQNYNLGMQEDKADKFDMSVICENMQKLDAALKAMQDEIDELKAAQSAEV